MFRKFIKYIIELLEKTNKKLSIINEKLNSAYIETYAEECIKEEISKRQEENKKYFIESMAFLESVNNPLIKSKKECLKRGEEMFQEAMSKGHLDELYKLKKELFGGNDE